MRRYFFRGKALVGEMGGKWVYGSLLQHDGKAYIFETYYKPDPRKHEVFTETVGQWTGLVDKNGNKICEGDVLEISGKARNGVVFWDDCTSSFSIGSASGVTDEWLWEVLFDDDPSTKKGGVKVIGNIHDNPELLK